MAQARERLARTDLDSADRGRVDIRRLPGSLYGDHGKCHGWHGDGRHRGTVLFLSAWAMMMVAMMVPATLPLILLYRTVARHRSSLVWARVGMVALLVGYIALWTAAGLPVYAYSLFAEGVGPLATVLPALLLVVGGIYQFTPLKHICHARCSNPLFFLMNNWRAGASGALRLGMLHGVDCLGCCAGLMV